MKEKIIFDYLKKMGPKIIRDYLPELLKQSTKATEYIKTVFEINQLKTKINGLEKDNEKSYINIGKEIYESGNSKSTLVKENIEKINNNEEKKEQIKAKIKELELKIKENKELSDLQDKFIDDVIKVYDDNKKVQVKKKKRKTNF